MAAAIHVWSLEVKPGEATAFVPAADLRITNIALGDEIADEKSRTTVKLIYRPPGAEDEDEEDEEDEDEPAVASAVLGSLTPGKIEQASIDLVLGEEEEYLIEVVGKNTVYLSGNYIDQQGYDRPPYDSEDESEDDYDLRDVSSDVEIDPNELDMLSDDEGRFEEIVDEEEAPQEASKDKSKKRPRESDTMETDEQEGKLSKSQKKQLKKLKAANGEAAEAPSPEKSEKKGEEKGKKEKKEKGDKEKGEKAKSVETKTLAGGVQVEDHKAGNGPAAKRGNHVSVRYVGKLTNGKVFDKNTNGKPFTFRLGSGEVIKGWDVGIEGMHVGGERKITIPAPMAYGKKAQPGIPANSTLVFEVKLLSIGK
ncbi:hypothetical protein OH76DRAFT_1408682 [Lentinus brumalis]|uniref:FK506-binding protein n=1 Tax=Lentinus brumalis TaxID=2498619 RepID=A0A371CX84_9APHY|nr:hypothetical protein OH76DRAFT_1408682 [Polyporus brumalis]